MRFIELPTLHAGQARVFNNRGRFNCVCCGRQWGKDVLQATIAADAAAKGKTVGLFAPQYAQLSRPYDQILEILEPIVGRANRSPDKMIETVNLNRAGQSEKKGRVDFWPTDDNVLAGRGRTYDVICTNEAAFSKSPQMLDIWAKSMSPTLVRKRGSAWIFSTPKGIDPDNFFYACFHNLISPSKDKRDEFVNHHAPTSDNPYIPQEEIEGYRRRFHPKVFQQEFLAEFVSWKGEAFFSLDKWLIDGQPISVPARCAGSVLAFMDCAVKSGKEHDATAVLYAATNEVYLPEPHWELILLDYDIYQIDGDLLPNLLQLVYQRLDILAKQCGALMGSKGAVIEDTQSGSILIKHALRRGWPVTAVDSKFVSLGKDERAMVVSEWHHQGLVKITDECLRKEIDYKGATRNHLVSQVTSFRIGDKDAHRRADDALDCYTAALSATFGTSEGY